MMKKCLLVLMLFMIAACSGPSNKDTCIPTRDQSSQGGGGSSGGASAGGSSGGSGETDLGGAQTASLEEIDAALKQAGIISTIVNKIKEKVVGGGAGGGGEMSGAQTLFEGVVQSQTIQMGIGAAFSLYVIIFGILVLGGMIQMSIGEVVIRVVKIAFVAIFAMNWADFYGFIGKASMEFTDEMLSYFLESFQGNMTGGGGMQVDVQNNVFQSLDNFLASSFSMKMMALLSALFFAGGSSGPIYALLIGLAVFFVFKAMMTVVLVYCFSLFARAMIFAVAPIFLAFMLFKPTFPLFDSWLKQLVNYSMQPVLVGAFLAFFLGAMQPFFDDMLKYQFCWMSIDGTKEAYSWAFIDPQTGNKVNFGANTEPAVEIQRILLFLGFGYIFYQSTKLGASMASGLAGTMAGSLTDATKGLGGLDKFMGGKGGGSKFTQLLSQT